MSKVPLCTCGIAQISATMSGLSSGLISKVVTWIFSIPENNRRSLSLGDIRRIILGMKISKLLTLEIRPGKPDIVADIFMYKWHL